MSKPNEIDLYRAEQKIKYEKKMLMKRIFDKYSVLLELNREKLAACRIVRFIKKFYFKENIKDDKVPGIYKIRMNMTELNSFPLEIQKDNYKDYLTTDQVMNKIIIDTISESFKFVCVVVLDLRLYGLYPEMEIFIPGKGLVLYLSESQILKIKQTWNKIDPETSTGIRFNQMIGASKSLATLYKQIK